jgi:predicted nucleic acid-binding OB-fold protein
MSNVRKDSDVILNSKLNQKSPVVEIFGAIASGVEINSKLAPKVDAVVARIKDLGQKASNGDFAAKAELNTIVRYVIEPNLTKVVQLFNFMGTFRDIGYEEQPMMKTYKHTGIRSGFQASQGDVPFAVTTWNEYPIGTQTISSGYAFNYREIASGNLDKVQEGIQQVQVDMMNKAMYYVILQMYNAIKNATGVKYFAEAAGITKLSVDSTLKKVRRFGQPAILGDYSVASQLNSFVGFKQDVADALATNIAQAAMEEIRKTGLISYYNGSYITELPNQYNLNSLNAAGDNFNVYLPEGLLFFVPQGAVSPLQVFRRGGMTSMTGNDIINGTEMSRYDMEIGAGVAKGREYEIGLISDSNFASPATF